MSVILNNIDDFISPSQECIKPVQSSRFPSSLTNNGPEKVAITLNDCLACSGCITSAESVLIDQQSHERVSKVLVDNQQLPSVDRAFVVVSISPQSRASIASTYGLSIKDSWEKLTHFFHAVGCDLVLDTTLSRELSLKETAHEFIIHHTEVLALGLNKKNPILTGICPGWVCYAEKSHGDYALPLISKVKSPQQIMGSIVKHCLARHLDIPPSKIYHVCVMPCFDKKLEASRDVFADSATQCPDVDCVISSAELFQLVDSYCKPLSDYPNCEPDSLLGVPQVPYVHSGGGSGGYAEFTFVKAAEALFSIESPTIKYVTRRNHDLQELELVVDGESKLKFALAYGFRNIQNVVQKVKQGRSPYDFIEIMACPSGCLNGGGQIKPSEGQENRDVLRSVTDLYHSVTATSPGLIVERLYTNWLNSDEVRHKYLLTEYKAVEKAINALTIKW